MKKLVVQFCDERYVTVYEHAVIALSTNYIRGSFGKSRLKIAMFSSSPFLLHASHSMPDPSDESQLLQFFRSFM